MKIIALSRRSIEASDLSSNGPCVAICIAYPEGRLHRVHPMGNLLAVHHERFSDCDQKGAWCFPEGKDPNNKAVPMTEGNAVDIVNFVEEWRPKVDTIYAACYGGVSRSRGVLAGLAAVHGWDDSRLYAEGHPNAWVKALIVREYRRWAR